MEFTLEFIQLFFIALWYASPLIAVLAVTIALLGRMVGRREGWSMADSLYYAFITATTVGYGDFHPKKRLSKHFAIAISFVGMILTGIVVALALSAAGHAFKASPGYQHLTTEVKGIKK